MAPSHCEGPSATCCPVCGQLRGRKERGAGWERTRDGLHHEKFRH